MYLEMLIKYFWIFLNYINRVNNNSSADISKMPYMDVSLFYYTSNKLSNSSIIPEGMNVNDEFVNAASALKLDINGEFLQMSFISVSNIFL